MNSLAPRRSTRRTSSSSLPLPPPPAPPTANSQPTTSAPKSRKRKAPAPAPAPATAAAEIDNDGFAVPATPKRKRGASKKGGVPNTPTPAAASEMGVGISRSSGDACDGTPPPPPPLPVVPNRVANPLGTNAPLSSPMSSRVLSQKASGGAGSDSPLSRAVKKGGYDSTTEDILEEALKHLVHVDPRLKAVIEKHQCRVFAKEGLMEVIDPFRSLVSGIISQQVSGAAAKSIQNRFIALFHPSPDSTTSSPSAPSPAATTTTFPTPTQVAASSIETLRTAGLSQRKAEYIQGLAAKFANGELTTEFLLNAEYEEVLEELVKVRGLGKWSVEMFACFGLKRMDVFSTGDLGVQRGMAALEGKDVSKLKAKGAKNKWKYMSEQDMLDISSKFAPYRSVFMWYMWRVEDTDVSTLESAA